MSKVPNYLGATSCVEGRSIAVFGGADVPASDPRYIDARRLGAALARAGHTVVCGGYYGLMEAVSCGARDEGGEVLGVTLGSFDPKVPNCHLTSRYHARDLYDRLRQIIHRSNAIVVLPGGLGTLVETTTAWLLKQVGQLATTYPIIVMDSALRDLAESAAGRLLMAQSDIQHLSFARDIDEVLAVVSSLPAGSVAVAPVTIGIAAWNAARHVEAAVQSALSQTVRATEILVVDDGSTDDTADRVARLAGPGKGLSVLRQDNLGTSAALNRILASCSTEYLLGLDADDMLEPNAVERFCKAAKEHPEAAIVYSDHLVIDEMGTEIAYRASAAPADLLNRLKLLHDRLAPDNTDNFLPAGHGRLYKVEAIRAIGGYSGDIFYAEDYDLVLRAAERWPCAHVPEALYRYRWHTTNKGIWGRLGQVEDVRESFRRHEWRRRNQIP